MEQLVEENTIKVNKKDLEDFIWWRDFFQHGVYCFTFVTIGFFMGAVYNEGKNKGTL